MSKKEITLDSVKITKTEFRNVEEIYRRSQGRKKLKKMSEGVYRTLLKLED